MCPRPPRVKRRERRTRPDGLAQVPSEVRPGSLGSDGGSFRELHWSFAALIHVPSQSNGRARTCSQESYRIYSVLHANWSNAVSHCVPPPGAVCSVASNRMI